jgi:predicted nucleic acid-binding protein
MLNSNVIISSIYTYRGSAFQALAKASEFPYRLVLSEQILDEVYRFFYYKFPSKVQDMQSTLESAHYKLILLDKKDLIHIDESMIRDINDRLILRAAKKANVELFITGDKDFLESKIIYPKILTIAQFLSL